MALLRLLPFIYKFEKKQRTYVEKTELQNVTGEFRKHLVLDLIRIL